MGQHFADHLLPLWTELLGDGHLEGGTGEFCYFFQQIILFLNMLEHLLAS